MKQGKDGYYRARIRIGFDDNGKPIDKIISAKTEAELERNRAAFKKHYFFGEEVPEDKQFYDYALEWYQTKKEPFISAASQKSYRSCFMKHILPEFGMQHLTAITAKQVQEFVTKFKGTSKSQITLVLTILRSVFASALAEGLIDRDPTAALVRPKSAKKEERRALTSEETTEVLRVIDSNEEGLFLAVLYYMGLRKGEALGLKWGDLDFKTNLAYIQRDIDFVGSTAQEGELKTAAAERYVPIPDELRKMLLKVKGRPEQYIFHTKDDKPLPQATVKRMWLRLMFDAGLVEWREVDEFTNRPDDITKQLKATITPHFLRHNYVTKLYEAGVDPLIAMKIVGHTDYQTTANIYTHLSEETLRKASVDMRTVFKKK